MSIGTSKPLAWSGGGGSSGPRNPFGVVVSTGTAHGYQYVLPVAWNLDRSGARTSGDPAKKMVNPRSNSCSRTLSFGGLVSITGSAAKAEVSSSRKRAEIHPWRKKL